MKNFSIATFNVRGLCDDTKKQQLATDITKYKVDIACLQETKIKKGCDENILNHQLHCFPTKEIAHGNGFVISEK